MKKVLYATCLFAALAVTQTPFALSEPFVAPAEPTGSIQVKLYPTENVAAGSPHLVTFGVPFTRSSISDVSTVRVLKGTVEIPANVQAQTPWRHMYNTAIDGQSVRVARIQLNYTFTVTYPNFEIITVEWGQNARTQNVATSVKARTAWHRITSGTLSVDNVWEPDVFAVLPKEVMARASSSPPACCLGTPR
jgi:hypothetical protein